MLSPLYFKRRKSTRIKQGKYQPRSTTPITIEEYISHQERELGQVKWKIEEVTSLKSKVKKPQTYQITQTTRVSKVK